MYIVFLCVFADTMATSVSNPVMPIYAQQFNATSTDIGWMYSATSIAALGGTALLSKLSDAWGRRPVFILACTGAGFAGVAQACARSFQALFVFRVFSGIWAAIPSVANVYISDVASPETLPFYMSKLAAVPNFSRTMGPGLGGGLSQFGVNIPILADGVMNLCLAVLVVCYVSESPVFLSATLEAEKQPAVKDRSLTGLRRQVTGQGGRHPVPWVTYGIALAQFFNGIQIGLTCAMLAISLRDKFGWTALDIGYLGVMSAVITVTATMTFTERAIKIFGAKLTATAGTFVIACGLVVMGLTQKIPGFLVGNAIRSLGMGVRQGSMGTVQAAITHFSNRGAVFGRIQMFNQAGQFVGPILGGYIALTDKRRNLWLIPAATTFFSAVILWLVHDHVVKKKTISLLDNMNLDSEGPLKDEEGTGEDYANLAEHVGGLLTRGHYRWVSRKEAVYAMLEKLLPELSTDGKDQVRDLYRIWESADNVHSALENSTRSSS